MHHNFLLEQCRINVSDKGLATASGIPTSFSVDGKKSTVRIGKDFEFIAEEKGKHLFKKAGYHAKDFFRSKGYSMMKVNHTDLSGNVHPPLKGYDVVNASIDHLDPSGVEVGTAIRPVTKNVCLTNRFGYQHVQRMRHVDL